MGYFMFCLQLPNKFPKGYNKTVLYHININPIHIYGNVSNCNVCLKNYHCKAFTILFALFL